MKKKDQRFSLPCPSKCPGQATSDLKEFGKKLCLSKMIFIREGFQVTESKNSRCWKGPLWVI